MWFVPWLNRFHVITNNVTWGKLVTRWLQFKNIGYTCGGSSALLILHFACTIVLSYNLIPEINHCFTSEGSALVDKA